MGESQYFVQIGFDRYQIRHRISYSEYKRLNANSLLDASKTKTIRIETLGGVIQLRRLDVLFLRTEEV